MQCTILVMYAMTTLTSECSLLSDEVGLFFEYASYQCIVSFSYAFGLAS
jgi:hypothetical protein